jgi:uncharacterized membrane protein YfcA
MIDPMDYFSQATALGVIFAICLLSGALQAAVGFGFGLVAVALLSLVFEIKEAAVLLVLAGLSLNLYVLYRLRAHFRFERMLPFLVAAVVGVPVGVIFLVHADVVLLKQVLGGLLLLSCLQRAIPHLSGHRWDPVAIGVPCGLFSGALAGAFGTGGPPAVAYVASQNFDKFRWVATMQAVFGITALIRLFTLGAGGMLSMRLVGLSACGALGAVLGARWGLLLLKRISPPRLKWAVTILLLLLGVHFLRV